MINARPLNKKTGYQNDYITIHQTLCFGFGDTLDKEKKNFKILQEQDKTHVWFHKTELRLLIKAKPYSFKQRKTTRGGEETHETVGEIVVGGRSID